MPFVAPLENVKEETRDKTLFQGLALVTLVDRFSHCIFVVFVYRELLCVVTCHLCSGLECRTTWLLVSRRGDYKGAGLDAIAATAASGILRWVRTWHMRRRGSMDMYVL